MQYLLLIYGNEAGMLAVGEAETARTLAAYRAYTEAMEKAGVLIGANRLRPTASAQTVRDRGGQSSVIDGPFAETKEQLGGYYLIEVADQKDALAWAARCPGAARGSIEVRPIWVMS